MFENRKLFDYIKPAPCDDGCKNFGYCRGNNAACTEFQAYVGAAAREKIKLVNRIPSTAVYKRIYG